MSPLKPGWALTGVLGAALLSAMAVSAAATESRPVTALEGELRASFACLLKPASPYRPPTLSVMVTSWDEEGRYRGEVTATFAPGRVLEYRIYGQARAATPSPDLESVFIETGADEPFDKRVPARCVR